MRLAWVVIGCLPVLSQTPDASSVIKTPGDTVTLKISANSDSERAPIELKWDVVYPAQVMDMETDNAGPAAMDSGKSLQCIARRSYAYVCVLSGGQNPIQDGLVAIYRFKIKPSAQAGVTKLRIENAESTTKESKKWALKSTEAIVVIR
jgi:hypothetical protein